MSVLFVNVAVLEKAKCKMWITFWLKIARNSRPVHLKRNSQFPHSSALFESKTFLSLARNATHSDCFIHRPIENWRMQTNITLIFALNVCVSYCIVLLTQAINKWLNSGAWYMGTSSVPQYLHWKWLNYACMANDGIDNDDSLRANKSDSVTTPNSSQTRYIHI